MGLFRWIFNGLKRRRTVERDDKCSRCGWFSFNGQFCHNCGFGLPNVTGIPVEINQIPKNIHESVGNMQMSSRVEEIKNKVDYFRMSPILLSVKDLYANPSLLPKERGIYGWYFNRLPPEIPPNQYIEHGSLMLLYVGIAGRNEASNSTLRSRIISQHIKGNAYGSTLRRTLGPLLLKELKLTPYPKGNLHHKGFYFGPGEKELTSWLVMHAWLAWIPEKKPWEIEDSILTTYGSILPLNIEKNPTNPVGATLNNIRIICQNQAWK